MAIINSYTQTEEGWLHEVVDYDGFAWQYITENSNGNNWQVYDGELCRSNEVSRNENVMRSLEDCTVFFMAAGDPFTIGLIAVAVVSATAVVLLTPKPKALDNVNRQQESPNNSLSRRNNEPRINQRIVDICGKVKSIPDVIQAEWGRYENGVEVRTGAYCVGRKQLLIEELKDSDTTFEDSEQSAGIYYPFKSPNNSAPDVQIGPAINEPIVGVFESSNAIDQTLKAKNDAVVALAGTGVRIFPTGVLNAGANIDLVLSVGDIATLVDVNYQGDAIGATNMEVLQVSSGQITFDISNDPSWSLLPPGGTPIDQASDPRIEKITPSEVGPFVISSIKIDRFVFNAYAANGMYKENNNGRRDASVTFRVYYQKLNDNLDPVGPETPVDATITGNSPDITGATVDVDLGGLTFIQWRAERITDKDYAFDGTVVDDIKIRSVYGLYDVNRSDFGDITMIQTQRRSLSETVLVKDPEVNCIATELVNKYENGSFSPTLTPNTQAFQSLIRLALDDKVGRRTEEELDLDLLVDVQQDIEDYFQNAEAGSFNYSFDSTDTTAQETFFTIANAAFSIVWREGRVLKAWFERPQTLPSMVFTHRSKVPDSETWTRNFSNNERKDSVELVYTDDQLYTQETFYVPEDRSGTNPERIEIPGLKGISQATWRAYREFNKLRYSEITVDFTSTAEGRFVKPSRLISVVKGTRVGTYDGYVMAIDGRVLTLSQEVVFTAGDDHSILLKRRDGSVESIPAFDIGEKRKIQLGFLPSEPVYVGNDEQKTNFSFGNEARLLGQWIIPQEINPSEKSQVQISGINYSDLYYQQDPIQPVLGGFSNGFSNGFDNAE